MFARSGKLIKNFDNTIAPELLKMGAGCYDGELMGQDFTALMRQAYRKENVDTSGTYLVLFDFLTLEEWDTKNATMRCDDRFEELLDRCDVNNIDLEIVQPVERTEACVEWGAIKQEHDGYVAEGYEGAMIKMISSPYKFGRGYEVMKLKAFHDVDLKVTGLLEGTGKHAGKLGSFQVLFNGVEVQVGSGLTDELREKIWKNPDNFLNRTIEVRYQEITPDGSLRFPTFVCFRNDRD
jgi:DNA ligase-1